MPTTDNNQQSIPQTQTPQTQETEMFQANADFDFGTVSTPVTTSDQDVQENISEAPSVEENSVDTSAFDFSLDLPSAYPEQEVSTPTTVASVPEIPSATMQMENLLADEPVGSVQDSSSQATMDLNISTPASAESEAPVASGPFAQDHYVGGADPFEAMKASLHPEEPVQQEMVSADMQTSSLFQEEKTDINQLFPSVSEDAVSQAPEIQEESLSEAQIPASVAVEFPSQVDPMSFLAEDTVNSQIESGESQSPVISETSNQLSFMENSTLIQNVPSVQSSMTIPAEPVEISLHEMPSAPMEAPIETLPAVQTVSLDDMIAQAPQVAADQFQASSSVSPQLEISVAPVSEAPSTMLSLDEMIAQPSVAPVSAPVAASSSQQIQDPAFAAVNPLTTPIGYPQVQQA